MRTLVLCQLCSAIRNKLDFPLVVNWLLHSNYAGRLVP